MPDPTPYSPDYDFTASDKGTELNIELASVAEASESLAAAIRDVRRADGKLQNGSVTVEALAPGVLSVLGPNGDVVIAAVDAAEAAADTAVAQVALATTAQAAATAQVALATAQADASATSATAAAASAATATTQAGIATTQAGLAAGSASTAASAGATAGTSAGATAGASAAATALAARPCFSAHMNGTDQTGLVTATWTKLLFGTELFDVGSAYNTANSRWTPAAGKYHISAAAQFKAGTVDARQCAIAVYKNGTIFRMFAALVSGTTDATAVNGSCIVDANGTDYFEIFAIGMGVGNKTVSGVASETWFEGSAI